MQLPATRIQECVDQGLIDDDMAEIFSCSASTVCRARRSYGIVIPHAKSLTPFKVQTLRGLHEDGFTLMQIVAELDTTKNVILDCMAQLKITPREPELTMRTCLGPSCRGKKKFMSSGIGERLCRNCKNQVNHHSEQDTYTLVTS